MTTSHREIAVIQPACCAASPVEPAIADPTSLGSHHPTVPSQQHRQSLAQRGLGVREPLGQFSKPGGARSRLVQPAPQSLPRQVAAFPVTQPDSVDDRAFRGVEARGRRAPTSSSSRSRSKVRASNWCRRQGARSAGRVLPRGIAMSIAAGIASMRPWRASAVSRHSVARGTRSAISTRSSSAGGASAQR